MTNFSRLYACHAAPFDHARHAATWVEYKSRWVAIYLSPDRSIFRAIRHPESSIVSRRVRQMPTDFTPAIQMITSFPTRWRFNWASPERGEYSRFSSDMFALAIDCPALRAYFVSLVMTFPHESMRCNLFQVLITVIIPTMHFWPLNITFYWRTLSHTHAHTHARNNTRKITYTCD